MGFYQQLKNWYHWLQAQAWRAWYRWPDRGLHLYGVTGTNGKTTTAHILAYILAAARGREHVGMLTTIAFWVGSVVETNETKLTTLPSRAVFRYLAQMRHAGVTHVVVEMTSHALDQHRLAGLRLEGAIILNVAREHLDYHGTMAAYATAKQKIIDYLKPQAPLVGKGDDGAVATIIATAQQHHIPVRVFTAAQAAQVKTPLPGAVNQENVLAATLLAEAIGITPTAIAKGVAACTHVAGRMEWFELATGARGLIDYAVTPDALERLYQTVRQQTTGKIYAVLGAAGLRDRGKRADMARAVARYADEIVLTREDPWTESEDQIFHDLEAGLTDVTISWQRIVDRREALRYCIARSGQGDVVVATGKGAERGMGIGTKVIPWNERTIMVELAQHIQ